MGETVGKDLTERKKKTERKKRPCRDLKISWDGGVEDLKENELGKCWCVSPPPLLSSSSGKLISPDPTPASLTRFVSLSSNPPASNRGETSFLRTVGDTV